LFIKDGGHDWRSNDDGEDSVNY
jgi:uncharacterized Tic20 family protein